MCAFRSGDRLDDRSTERQSGWVEAAVGADRLVAWCDCSVGEVFTLTVPQERCSL